MYAQGHLQEWNGGACTFFSSGLGMLYRLAKIHFLNSLSAVTIGKSIKAHILSMDVVFIFSVHPFPIGLKSTVW